MFDVELFRVLKDISWPGTVAVAIVAFAIVTMWNGWPTFSKKDK